MCDASQAAGASLGLQAGGAAASTIGSIASAVQTKAALRSAARIADINAGMTEVAAGQTRRDGMTMASRRKMEGERTRSAQVARMAANNIVVGDGSSAAVLASTDYATTVDADQIEANAIRQALGLKTEAGNLRAQAAGQRALAAGISPFLEGATSALTGAASVAQSYYKLQQSGALTPTRGFPSPAAPNFTASTSYDGPDLRKLVDSISNKPRSDPFRPKVSIFG